MPEYDSGPRYLSWDLLHPLVGHRTVEDDGSYPPSSFVWPADPDEKTLVPFWLSLNEYNILGSTIDVGSDVAFGEDALRVVWLWMRNMRIQVPICDAIIHCINTNPATITAIVNQLIINPTFNEYLTQVSVTTNIYPPRPTAATPDPLCNAATYCVAQLRKLISDIYNDLETLDASEVLSGLLGLAGWRSSPLYALIGLLETNDKTALLAAFDAAAPDLICELIAEELNQAPILSWIASVYPPPSVLGDALTYGVQSAADDGRWAMWIAVGATMTDATCDCGTPGTEWSIVPIEGYETGIIDDQTDHSATFIASANTDGLYRMVIGRTSGDCVEILSITQDAVSPYPYWYDCAETLHTTAVAVGDEVKRFSYAGSSPFVVEITW